MTLEENIFNNAIFNFQKLSAFGFVKKNNEWIYSKTFMNNAFQAVITINRQGNVTGNVYDMDSNDIYFPLRIESMANGFAGEVRCEYEKILRDIQNKCCHINYFIYQQANRLTQHIYTQYGDKPDFPWKKFDGYGVFKNSCNGKWYALIMPIEQNKLNQNLSGKIEIVNIKLDKNKIQNHVKQRGFYPAYHMNKINWITLVLNETISDDVLYNLIDESYSFTLNKKTL